MSHPRSQSLNSGQQPAGANGVRSTPLLLEAAFTTHPGVARTHNEDAIWVTPLNHPQISARGCLMVVADGMGGHNAGEVASQAAVRGVFERYYTDTEPDIHRSLDNAVRRTNAELFNQAQANPTQRGMGTTLTVAVIKGNRLYWAHVGDSRLYLIRGGQPEQLTQDHSWVEEQVRAGVLTRLQAESHPQRNVITRALATNPDVKVDRGERELAAGDVLVLCSDGLNTEVGDAQIAAHATKATTAKEAVDRLIRLANDNGGEDNISVAVVRFGAGTTAAIVADGDAMTPLTPRKSKSRALILAAAGLVGVVVLALAGALVIPPLINPTPTPVAYLPAKPSAQNVQPTVTLALPTDTQPGSNIQPAMPTTAGQPAEALEPTATLRPLSTATATPTPRSITPTPPIGRERITPTPTLRRVPAPVLGDPNGSTEPGPGITFTWQDGGYKLGPGEGYALLAWKEENPQYKEKKGLDLPALYDACSSPQRETRLSVNFAETGGKAGPGVYCWTVVVVDTQQKDPSDPKRQRCQVISDQPTPHRFTYGGGAPQPPAATPTVTPVPPPLPEPTPTATPTTTP